MERQQQSALISCSALVVDVVGVVVGVAGATLGAFVVVVVGVGGGAILIISNSLGSFGTFFEPFNRPFGPRVFAVVLYLARGAVAQTVLELDVHVIHDALIRYRRA